MFVSVRTSLRVISLVIIATLIIGCVFLYIFRPIYSVTLNGEVIGYTENKSKLQNKINKYIESGDGENVAFVQVDQLPEYEMCLLKKGKVANDDEILTKIKEQGTQYYEYYAITLDNQEKYFVGSYNDAKAVIDGLKEKKSNNIAKLGMVKKYDVTLAETVAVTDAVSKLYEKPPVVKKVVKSSYTPSYNKTVNTTSTKKDLGIALIRPVSGTITSRFGYRRTGLHTGLDIANSTGTTIVAAAGGTVKFAGVTSSGYGKYIVISHGNGIETYYAHCSSLYVTAGQQVSQGQKIAAVGSTGNSTGPHLHFEVRINGSCQNPQNYVY